MATLHLYNPKDPNKEIYEVDDTPDALEQAKAKGYKPVIMVSHPNDPSREEIPVDADNWAEAQKKGFMMSDILKQQDAINKAAEEKQTQRLSGGLGKVESAARGFANPATLGLGDELVGAKNEPMGALKTAANFLPGVNIEDTDTRNYKAIRDKERQANELAKKVNPGMYYAGAAVPVATTLLITAPEMGAMSVGEAALQGAKMGAGTGAVTGLGESKASTGRELAGDVALSAGVGGVAGGALGAATNTVGGYLSNRGVQAAENVAGLNTKASRIQAVKDALRGRTSAPTGEQVLESGMLKGVSKPSQLAERALENQQEAGKVVGNVAKDIDTYVSTLPLPIQNAIQSGASPKALASSIRTQAAKLTPAQNELRDKLLQEATRLEAVDAQFPGYNWGAKTAQEFKTAADQKINWARNPLAREPITEQSQKAVRALADQQAAKVAAEAEAQGKPFARAIQGSQNQKYQEATNLSKGAMSKLNANDSYPWFEIPNPMRPWQSTAGNVTNYLQKTPGGAQMQYNLGQNLQQGISSYNPLLQSSVGDEESGPSLADRLYTSPREKEKARIQAEIEKRRKARGGK